MQSLGHAAFAEGDCAGQAVSALERLYCKVMAGGEGVGLPSLQDFRQNDSQIQSLLLKRRAAALGLGMPTTSEATATAPAIMDNPPAVSSNERDFDPRLENRVDLSGCSLENSGRTIRCSSALYDLASNEPLASLSPTALASTNRLGIASFSGDISSAENVQHYLSDAYRRYIPKMLEIGLGAATLSFTEFDRAFQINEASGVDFARRLEASYALLRKDRLTLAVNTDIGNERPDDIASCEQLDEQLIVCDNVSMNWVFVHR